MPAESFDADHHVVNVLRQHHVFSEAELASLYREAQQLQQPLAELLLQRKLITEKQAEFLQQAVAQEQDVQTTWAPRAKSFKTLALESTGRSSETRLPNLGDTLGGYTLATLIGQGAMGQVFLGVQESRKVAIKIATIDLTEEALLRFARESQAMAAVDRHANIVKVHSSGKTESGLPYFVLDFVEGQAFDEVLKARQSQRHVYEPRQFLDEFLWPIARALDFVHSQEIVHRDLKPANILIRADDGVPYLTDFGIAHLANQQGLTQTGEVLGTPAYMAPEQFIGDKVSPATDQWALACIAFECLTLQRAFAGHGAMQIYNQVVNKSARTATDCNTNLPLAVNQVFARSFAKAMTERYSSATDFVAALDYALFVEKRRIKKTRKAAAVLAVLTLFVIATWFFYNPKAEPIKADFFDRVLSTQLQQSLTKSIPNDKIRELGLRLEESPDLNSEIPELIAILQILASKSENWRESLREFSYANTEVLAKYRSGRLVLSESLQQSLLGGKLHEAKKLLRFVRLNEKDIQFSLSHAVFAKASESNSSQVQRLAFAVEVHQFAQQCQQLHGMALELSWIWPYLIFGEQLPTKLSAYELFKTLNELKIIVKNDKSQSKVEFSSIEKSVFRAFGIQRAEFQQAVTSLQILERDFNQDNFVKLVTVLARLRKTSKCSSIVFHWPPLDQESPQKREEIVAFCRTELSLLAQVGTQFSTQSLPIRNYWTWAVIEEIGFSFRFDDVLETKVKLEIDASAPAIERELNNRLSGGADADYLKLQLGVELSSEVSAKLNDVLKSGWLQRKKTQEDNENYSRLLANYFAVQSSRYNALTLYDFLLARPSLLLEGNPLVRNPLYSGPHGFTADQLATIMQIETNTQRRLDMAWILLASGVNENPCRERIARLIHWHLALIFCRAAVDPWEVEVIAPIGRSSAGSAKTMRVISKKTKQPLETMAQIGSREDRIEALSREAARIIEASFALPDSRLRQLFERLQSRPSKDLSGEAVVYQTLFDTPLTGECYRRITEHTLGIQGRQNTENDKSYQERLILALIKEIESQLKSASLPMIGKIRRIEKDWPSWRVIHFYLNFAVTARLINQVMRLQPLRKQGVAPSTQITVDKILTAGQRRLGYLIDSFLEKQDDSILEFCAVIEPSLPETDGKRSWLFKIEALKLYAQRFKDIESVAPLIESIDRITDVSGHIANGGTDFSTGPLLIKTIHHLSDSGHVELALQVIEAVHKRCLAKKRPGKYRLTRLAQAYVVALSRSNVAQLRAYGDKQLNPVFSCLAAYWFAHRLGYQKRIQESDKVWLRRISKGHDQKLNQQSIGLLDDLALIIADRDFEFSKAISILDRVWANKNRDWKIWSIAHGYFYAALSLMRRTEPSPETSASCRKLLSNIKNHLTHNIFREYQEEQAQLAKKFGAPR